MRPRTAVALGLAGLATTGLGTAVLPAGAQIRAFQVTLTDGRVLNVTVDVDPSLAPADVVFPEIPAASIARVEETPVPAPVAQTAPPAEPPAPTAPPAPEPGAPALSPEQVAPLPGQPAAPPAHAPGDLGHGHEEEHADGELAAAEPEAGESSAQRTTGTEKRRSTDRTRTESSGATTTPTSPPAPDAPRSREPGEAGLPTIANPTTSIAEPGAAPIGVPNFFIDKFRIPPFLLPIYQAAGIEYGIRWELLAAINEIETDYGRNLNVSSAGALGWMQFMPGDVEGLRRRRQRRRRKDPYNPVDAIFSAARYLRAAGAEEDLRKAIFAYNHADWYVDSVLMRARLIGGLPSNLIGSLTGLTQGRFPSTPRRATPTTSTSARRTSGLPRGATRRCRSRATPPAAG
jgi:hypothetical protein